jgi:hypothetical protein
MCGMVLTQEIGVRIVRLNWIVVLVANDEMLGFLRQPNLPRWAIALNAKDRFAVSIPTEDLRHNVPTQRTYITFAT